MDRCWFTTTKREGSTFGRFQLHFHGVDVIVDVVNEVLVGSFVVGDETEVICVWESDEASAMEVVPRLDVILEVTNDGVVY